MTNDLINSTIAPTDITGRISSIIETARNCVRTVVDAEMVRAYWEIVREIVEDEGGVCVLEGPRDTSQ